MSYVSRTVVPSTMEFFMKPNRFLSLAAIFAIALTFFACSSEEPSEPPYQGGESQGEEPSSSDSQTGEPQISSSSVTGNAKIECKGNFLGMGYDVIKSRYINSGDVKKSNLILDQDKMCQDAIIVTETMTGGTQSYEYFTSNSIKSFYEKRNTNIGFSYGSGVTGVLFSGNFSAEFSNATNQNSVERIFYSRVVSHRYTQDDYIKNATSQNLSKYLTTSFTNDLKNKTASDILTLYGTHVFIRYYKGGSLEANYTYTGTNLSNESQVDAAVRASFAGISGSASTSTQATEIEKTENTSFNYYVYGGRAIGATSVQQLKNEYSGWVNSIASNADICGITTFDQSFIAIWELARAAGETSKATQLENEFKSRAATQGVALDAATKVFITAEQLRYTTGSGTINLNELRIPSVDRAKAVIAEIEIYALGAGGGGQGGNYSGMIITEKGTGGAGGGGAATYAKLRDLGLKAGESVSLSVTVGTGGSGGAAYTSTATQSGSPGTKGTNTTVSWTNKSISIIAEGGAFGGASVSDKLVSGGTGGAATNRPSSSLITDWDSKSGTKGEEGNFDEDGARSNGGKAATINKGSLSSFGGGNGATATQSASNGGGGSGGYYANSSATSGKAGGNGEVVIIVKYYVEK